MTENGRSLRGTVPVVLAGIILLVGIWALASSVRSFRIPPLAVLDDAFSQQLVGGADGCEWRLSVDVRNTTTSQLRVISLSVDGPGSIRDEPKPVVLQPKARRTLQFVRLVAPEVCAQTVDDVVHGPVIIDFRKLDAEPGQRSADPEQLVFDF